MYNNVVLSSTTNNPAVPKTEKFSPQPPPEVSISSTHYETLSAGVSRHPADVSGPTYGNPYDGEQPAATVTYDDYEREAMMPMSQLMPLYASHHHHSISAYQHQLQQQQKQPSDYAKTQTTAREQSDAQGRSDWTIKFVIS